MSIVASKGIEVLAPLFLELALPEQVDISGEPLTKKIKFTSFLTDADCYLQ